MVPIRVTLIALPFAGFAALAATPASAAAKGCDVEVNRSYADGTYEVTKQIMPNKDCVCYIQTGKDPQSAAIEQKIVALRRARECDDAVVMAIPAGSKAVAGATAGSSFMKIVPALAAAGAATAAVAASAGGPSSP